MTDPAAFLDLILCARPVRKQRIEQRAAEFGFSLDQLDRAKKKLGVIAFKERGTTSGGWYWALPEHAAMIPANKRERQKTQSRGGTSQPFLVAALTLFPILLGFLLLHIEDRAAFGLSA
jgi:hypothetical protein